MKILIKGNLVGTETLGGNVSKTTEEQKPEDFDVVVEGHVTATCDLFFGEENSVVVTGTFCAAKAAQSIKKQN